MATREEVVQAEALPIEPKHRQEIDEVRAPYFAEEVRRQLLARYGDKALYGSGMSVRTSLDPRLQAAADRHCALGSSATSAVMAAGAERWPASIRKVTGKRASPKYWYLPSSGMWAGPSRS